MKYLLLFITLFICTSAKCQTLYPYKDTVNHFNIGVPAQWHYGILKQFPTIKLFAYRVYLDSADKPHENFNVNIIDIPVAGPEAAYDTLIASLSRSAKDFRLIKQGDAEINGMAFKWCIESHKNIEEPDKEMCDYVYVTVANEKTYILTFVVFSKYFDQYRSLFEKIAYSFSVQ